MSKRNSAGATSGSSPAASAAEAVTRSGNTPAAAPHHLLPSSAAIRETIESVAIAFILAFLFRTFEAEAFVIPTGSMAPTLMGRHKDVVCPKCGCPYQVSASEEVNSDGSLREEVLPNGMRRVTNSFQIMYGTCPMCRYTTQLDNDTAYNGDRILVSKFAYQVADPERWDVIVFKYPGDSDRVPVEERTDSRTNFIKRLVGLPGDTLRIQDGDVWLLRPGGKQQNAADYAIARKPPSKLLAMLQPVFDNDYMPKIAKLGWPERWYSESASPAKERTGGAWRTDDSAAFLIDGTAKGEQWLRYHHLAPSYQQWLNADNGAQPNLKPQLITDFTAYDTGKMRMEVNRSGPGPAPDGLGQHWVGDLAVECTADVEGPSGSVALELCKGGRRFQCRFDLATGQATLSISGEEAWHPTASTAVRGKGKHKLLFSNCDDELRLWVDGSLVSFDAKTTYPRLDNTRPDGNDLAPVGVASTGAAVRISHLRVFRDLYYIADRLDSGRHDVSFLPDNAVPGKEIEPQHLDRFVEFSLAKDRFFVLGDNSAKSKDSRLWGQEYWVPRDLLIGKALFIYWPHTWNRIPYVNIPFPYFPNFGRMGLVR
jgi:signal peptidase I